MFTFKWTDKYDIFNGKYIKSEIYINFCCFVIHITLSEYLFGPKKHWPSKNRATKLSIEQPVTWTLNPYRHVLASFFLWLWFRGLTRSRDAPAPGETTVKKELKICITTFCTSPWTLWGCIQTSPNQQTLSQCKMCAKNAFQLQIYILFHSRCFQKGEYHAPNWNSCEDWWTIRMD